MQSAANGPVTTQSVFAGSYTVQARVTKGTPIITMKPNATTPQSVEGAAVEEIVHVALSRRWPRQLGSSIVNPARPLADPS